MKAMEEEEMERWEEEYKEQASKICAVSGVSGKPEILEVIKESVFMKDWKKDYL